MDHDASARPEPSRTTFGPMLRVLDDEIDPDPATVILTCANCGADERPRR